MQNLSKKEPNYQTNIFIRYGVRQQHITMFVGYVFGRHEVDYESEDDFKTVTEYAREFIEKFNLDLDAALLYNSYRNALQVFKECLKAEKLLK
jgi:hypothetical protein